MSKVICDVCGTSYPDTATQCPICGCVRTASTQSVSSSAGDGAEGAGGYTYVKGGRFSKANVRKRNIANGVVSVNMVSDHGKNSRKNSGGENKGLIIAAIVLVLAIIAVILFMVVRFFINNDEPVTNPDQTNAASDHDDDLDETIACDRIYFDLDEIEFEKAGDTEKLVVIVEPEDCNEPLGEVTSDDPAVATAVIKDGVVTVTAVGPGETKIKLNCGSAIAVCSIKCSFEEEKELVIPESIELTKKGETKDIYPSDILRTDIEWTSDNEAVATVSNGTVKAVSDGTAIIRAKYNEQTAECVVTCKFAEDTNDTGNNENNNNSNDNDIVNGTGGVTEDGGSGSAGNGFALRNPYGNATDISLFLSGNKVAMLQLVDSTGNPVSGVTWSTGDSEKCTVTDGNVTAVGEGTTKVTATYNGQTYSCTIRVHS